MQDGYALIEFNTEGQGRVKDFEWLDIRLTVLDVDAEDIWEQLEGQFPSGIKDILVMAAFKYLSEECGDGFSVEYEDVFFLESHFIMKNNYKEFYRIQVTEQLKFKKDDYSADVIIEANERHYNEIVQDWEEFYEEEFIPFVKPTPVIETTTLFNDF